MRALPSAMARVLAPFAPLFSERVWRHARLLLVGAVLTPGRRTVSSCLRVMGLDREERFHRYHRVLSRASWLYKNAMPYLSCTAPGRRFTRAQFAAVSAAPLVVIPLVGALCVAFVPLGGWLTVPVGAHLGGCIGDIWFLGIMARLPRGTLLEDLVTGMRIMRPVV